MLIDRRSEKIAKRLIGRTEMEDALKRLDKLTQDEVRMAIAQNLKVTHTVDKGVKEVVDTVVAMDDRVARVDDQVASINDRVASVDNTVKGVDDRVKGADDRVKGVDDRVKIVDDKVAEVIAGV